MLVRFNVTINDAFPSTGGVMMNKTVAMALMNKDAGLVRVPAPNSGNTRRMVLKGRSQQSARAHYTFSWLICLSQRHDPYCF